MKGFIILSEFQITRIQKFSDMKENVEKAVNILAPQRQRFNSVLQMNAMKFNL